MEGGFSGGSSENCAQSVNAAANVSFSCDQRGYKYKVRFKRILRSTNQNDILIRDSVVEAFVQNIDTYR